VAAYAPTAMKKPLLSRSNGLKEAGCDFVPPARVPGQAPAFADRCHNMSITSARWLWRGEPPSAALTNTR